MSRHRYDDCWICGSIPDGQNFEMENPDTGMISATIANGLCLECGAALWMAFRRTVKRIRGAELKAVIATAKRVKAEMAMAEAAKACGAEG